MYETTIVGRVANITFNNVKCTKCGRWESTINNDVCPKCGNALVPLISAENKIFSIIEISFYPDFKEEDIKREHNDIEKLISSGKNTYIIGSYRIKYIYYPADKNPRTLPPLLRYLTIGRHILIKKNDLPARYTPYYSKKNQRHELEQSYILHGNKGDKIKLLGSKEEVQTSSATISYTPTQKDRLKEQVAEISNYNYNTDEDVPF